MGEYKKFSHELCNHHFYTTDTIGTSLRAPINGLAAYFGGIATITVTSLSVVLVPLSGDKENISKTGELVKQMSTETIAMATSHEKYFDREKFFKFIEDNNLLFYTNKLIELLETINNKNSENNSYDYSHFYRNLEFTPNAAHKTLESVRIAIMKKSIKIEGNINEKN